MHKQTRGSARLRTWMTKNGKNQKQLGEMIGVHQTMVGAWLLGRPISLPHAVALRRVTKIPEKDWTIDAEPAESGTDVSAPAVRAS